MFGYIRCNIPEMKMWEYEAYRGVYCGLCRSMGKCTGCISRMTLSYDFTFLTMVRNALCGEEIAFDTFTCPVHPFKRRVFMLPSASLDYTARACAVLFREKLRDDIKDERGIKRFLAGIAAPLGMYFEKRAGMTELSEKIRDLLSKLDTVERERVSSVDVPADIFGDVMAELCAFGLSGASERIGREIGRAVGKFVYIADALDDLLSDKKSGSYNPLLLSYGEDAFVSAVTCGEKDFSEMYDDAKHKYCGKRKKTLIPDEKTSDMISLAMKLELKRLEGAVRLLDFSSCPAFKNIVENTVLSGMPRVISSLCGHNLNAYVTVGESVISPFN